MQEMHSEAQERGMKKKLTDEAITTIKSLLGRGIRTSEVAKMLRIPKSQIDNLAVELGYRTPALSKGWRWPASVGGGR